jgi:hypothetical protein
MRRMRLFVFWALAALAIGCLNLETHVVFFQDGSGVYTEKVEMKKELIDFAMSQGGFASYEELLADAVQKAQQELQGAAGVKLLDVRGEWASNDALRITVVYGFDSAEKWNAFATVAKKPSLTFVAEQEKRTKKKKAAETVWTIGFQTNVEGIAKNAAPAEGAKKPEVSGPDAMSMNVGTFRIALTGPGPARETAPLPADEGIQAQLPDDGSAVFSGPLTAALKQRTFEAKFAGAPLSAAGLEAAKKAAFIEPSAQYGKLQQLIAQRQEREAVRQAGEAAILGSQFTVKIAIGADGKVRWETTQTYLAPTAAFAAGREALLDALAPDAAGNYSTKIEAVKATDGRPGVAFVRTRVAELPLERLAGLISVKRDGADWVYTIQPPQLLTNVSEKSAAATLGKLIVTFPDPVTGANAPIAGPHEIAVELSGANLRDPATLIVRTTPVKK